MALPASGDPRAAKQDLVLQPRFHSQWLPVSCLAVEGDVPAWGLWEPWLPQLFGSGSSSDTEP